MTTLKDGASDLMERIARFRAAIEARRAEPGYTPEPPTRKQPADGMPDCPDCGNEEFVQVVTELGNVAYQQCPKCQQARKMLTVKRMAAAYSSANGIALTQNFNNYIPRDATTKAALMAARGLAEENSPLWFYVYGRPGNGKSHLCAAVYNATLAKATAAIFITAPDLFSWLRAAFDEDRNSQGDNFTRRMALVKGVQVLILDDLGAERPTDWSNQTLYEIIDHRYRNRMPTMLSSNLAPNQLEEARVTSRVNDRVVCAVIAIAASDYRALPVSERGAK